MSIQSEFDLLYNSSTLDDLVDKSVISDDLLYDLLTDLDSDESTWDTVLPDDATDISEDADLIKPSKSHIVDPVKSRAAKERYRNNREKYRRGFDKFKNSVRGKLFYKKLSRYNSRHDVESLIDQYLNK